MCAWLARLLRTPVELVEFHLWYPREKGWVQRLDTGHLAISALGVDQIEGAGLRLADDRLLAAHAARPAGAGRTEPGEEGAIAGSIEERGVREPETT